MVRVSIDGDTYEFKSGRIADMIRAVIVNRHEVAFGNKTLHLECNGKQIRPKVTTALDTINRIGTLCAESNSAVPLWGVTALFYLIGGIMTDLTPMLIGSVLGAILSLVASYVPKFRTWWAALEPDIKMATMLIANIVASVAIYGLACTPALGFTFVACPTGGFWALVAIIFSTLVVNQNVDRVSPDTQDVKAVKEAKKP